MKNIFWTLKLIRTYGLIDVIRALYFPMKETEASKEVGEWLEEPIDDESILKEEK